MSDISDDNLSSTEQAFLDAIESTPDSFNRLVFADWLEEHGDARADIIRAIEHGDLSVIGKPIRETVTKSDLSLEQFVFYAADCAGSVLHIWEEQYPDNSLLRLTIQLSREVVQTKADAAASEARATRTPVSHAADDAAWYYPDTGAYDAAEAVGSALDASVHAADAYAARADTHAGPAARAARDARAIHAARVAAGAAADHAADSRVADTGDSITDEVAWNWNLKRLAEYQYFRGRKLWT